MELIVVKVSTTNPNYWRRISLLAPGACKSLFPTAVDLVMTEWDPKSEDYRQWVLLHYMLLVLVECY